ncbi:CBL-interacting serine/threonine-protein kinase 12 [Lathyrus oleraceus]|uniref:non-specific serine/threonine protein kinase n=1 Tax=Pisum sativum TaxID=3888 RepID=A0A9D4ZWK9_PEA|nr:CBL-interacting serine/threonine-protein kinase 12 [Pisum sativum]
MAVVAAPKKNNSFNKKDNPNLLLGRFELGKLLGHGTFAKVHLAKNIKTGEAVAIKIISKDKILKSGLVSHIKREISILRRVRHPNIVQLFEVMATKTKIYFVMEYVRGGELFNKVAKGRLKEEVARKYFQQLICAVEFCHARGVFHRDIKPENLLLDENGNLKVSDFGLSAVSDEIKQDGLFHTFCGTPAYVAPEVLSRKGYDGGVLDGFLLSLLTFLLGFLILSLKLGFRFRRLWRIVLNIDEHRDEALESVSESEWDSEVVNRRKNRQLGSLPRPASLNAFDIISFSQGFDLSGLFEEKGDEARFVSGASVSKIMTKLEEVAQLVSFKVRKKDCRVSFEGSREGVKGPLSIAAEVFELTPSLVVVEVKKKGGDKVEYDRFLNTELKPALHSLTMEESAGSSCQNTPDETLQQRAFSDSAIDKHSDSIESLNLDT